MRSVRRRNFNDPGHAHELTFSCYRGFPFLRAERTCGWLKAAIDEARETYRFDVWAYGFMPEHVHLLIRPRDHEYNSLTNSPAARTRNDSAPRVGVGC